MNDIRIKNDRRRYRHRKRVRQARIRLVFFILLIAAVCAGAYFLLRQRPDDARAAFHEQPTYSADEDSGEIEDSEYGYIIEYLSLSQEERSRAVTEDERLSIIAGLSDEQLVYLERLITLTASHPEAGGIIDKINIYPEALLKLVCREDEAISFVAGYFDNLYTYTDSGSIDISSDISPGEIPHFLQWDKRWGYCGYDDDIMATGGCGPTALSMVVVGLTGDTAQNPLAVAEFAENNGYAVSGYGTSWSLMSEGAKSFGLETKELSLDPNIIINTLKNGNPIIVALRPGDFTDVGHFAVLTGVDSYGKIIVRDPNSVVRSAKTWDVDVFIDQASNLWTFTI